MCSRDVLYRRRFPRMLAGRTLLMRALTFLDLILFFFSFLPTSACWAQVAAAADYWHDVYLGSGAWDDPHAAGVFIDGGNPGCMVAEPHSCSPPLVPPPPCSYHPL